MGAAASSGLGQKLFDSIVEAQPEKQVDGAAVAAKMSAAFAVVAPLVAKGDCVDYRCFPRGARRSRSRGARAPAPAGEPEFPAPHYFI